MLDRRIGWFEAEVEWNGETIRITFHADDDFLPKGVLETSEALWNDQAEWKRKVEDYAVSELLELKNDTWLDDNEQPLTAQQFKDRMSLQSISIRDDGAFDFWHDDGDLFWGHTIQISGSLKEGLTRADIPG